MYIFYLLRRAFNFLNKLYQFKENNRQIFGAYHYIEWSNSNIKIKVMYDEREENPITIFLYDANSLGTIYDVNEIRNEVATDIQSPRAKIRYASKWLSNAIVNEEVII